MGNSMGARLPLMQLEKRKTEVLTSTDAVKTVEDTLGQIEPLVWVGKALALSGIPEKVAAMEMGISRQLLNLQLANQDGSGKNHLSMQRLSRLPREFWQAFFTVGGPAVGVAGYSPDVIADHEVMQAFRRRLREAK